MAQPSNTEYRTPAGVETYTVGATPKDPVEKKEDAIQDPIEGTVKSSKKVSSDVRALLNPESELGKALINGLRASESHLTRCYEAYRSEKTIETVTAFSTALDMNSEITSRLVSIMNAFTMALARSVAA